MSFTVAIVGRPNVGKSTLFNRLVGRRLALVDDCPGVTPDRREGRATLGDLAFTVIDTAGLYEALRTALPDATAPDAARDDAERAAEESDEAWPIRIAVVGRPNSGKSTLINRLLGEERLLTGPEAGITRDAIAVDVMWQDRH